MHRAGTRNLWPERRKNDGLLRERGLAFPWGCSAGAPGGALESGECPWPRVHTTRPPTRMCVRGPVLVCLLACAEASAKRRDAPPPHWKTDGDITLSVRSQPPELDRYMHRREAAHTLSAPGAQQILDHPVPAPPPTRHPLSPAPPLLCRCKSTIALRPRGDSFKT